MAYVFNPFTGNLDNTGGAATIPDPLVVNNLTVNTLLTANHIHGDLAGSLYIHVKNTSLSTLPKGTPVYVTGAVGDTTTLEIAAADSSNPAKMPAVGILADQLAPNALGHATVAGELTNLSTNTYAINAPLYVAAGGGLTNVKPTTGSIQRVAIVGRSQLNTGSVTVTITGEQSPNWDTAYSDRLKWDGGSTGLNATTGRTSLGLGNSSTLNVGTTAGTVAAGDDSRFHSPVTLAATTTNILSVTGQQLAGVNPGGNRIVAWDNTGTALSYWQLGTGLSVTAGTLNAAGGTPGGLDTYVQFNDNGTFGGDIDLSWNKTTNVLNVRGTVRLDDAVGTFDTIVQSVPATATRYITFPDKSGLVVLADGIRTKSVFTATDSQPPATNFARRDTRNSVPVLEFRDTPADESTVFLGVLAEGTDVSLGLLVRVWWMADTATSGNVRWAAEFERLVTDLDADSFDTATEITTTTSATSGVPVISSMYCSAIDSIMAGDAYRLRITRRASNLAEDNMDGDAQVVAVEVRGVA